MIFACDKNNQRIHIDVAAVRQDYFCPSCGALLSQRKGEIRRHHFAHLPNHTCSDTWDGQYDMSSWHFEWQSRFPYDNQEILLSFGNTKHRADILIGRTVIEFQHSSISAGHFGERNQFYYNLGYKVIWFFDLIDQYENGQLISDETGTHFRWQHPKNTFNTYDIQSGQVELFFQLEESETESCIVKVSDVSISGIQEFDISRWYSKAEFMEYLGVVNGICAAPNREDLSENKIYKAFREKYHIILNKQQERAVQSVEGANLLLAVPGSGKTTVLVTRLGFMILCKNINPRHILAMTYTKAATKDMRERFAELFGEQLSNKLEFRTINGIADITIKRYAQKTKRPAFELLTDEKRKTSIIRNILKNMQDDFPTENDIIEAETAITYIKNMMLTKEEIAELKTVTPNIAGVYEQYQNALGSRHLMDYDDQLVYALKILKKNSDILVMFHREFQYICVDEAQDTSKVQHEIIRLLAGKTNNIFMVGDEDQSIYGFRAAYPKALTNFKNDYPNPFILFMEQNYRSTEKIVNKASAFIENNRGRYKKHIYATRSHGEPVKRISVETRAKQYQFLIDTAKNTSVETTILYRDNDCIIPLVDLMLRSNIPFQALRVKGTFFTHRVVADICAFLKLALNPDDADSFMQIYYKCGYGFNKKTAEWTCTRSKREHISIADALVKQLDKWKSLARKADDFKEFITALSKQNTITALSMIYSNGYGAYMRKNNLDYGKYELLTILSVAESSIKNFIIRLGELHKIFSYGKSIGSSGIILSTAHSSKGLEYDTVYLMDIYDGVFPSVDMSQINESKETMEKYQEERRLFYVAMTRAKNKLAVLSINNKSTSFVDEILPIEKPKSEPIVPFTSDPIVVQSVRFSQENFAAQQKKCQEEFARQMQQQKEAKEKAKAARQAAEQASIHRGYEEIKDRFTQQEERIVDSCGRRWIKCEQCGEIKQEHDFSSYGGLGRVNLGICSECSRKNR